LPKSLLPARVYCYVWPGGFGVEAASRVEVAMSECLHCDINELVRERLEQGDADLAEITAMIVEALADVILLAPESDQAKIMADALAHLGHMFLEKSGAIEPESSRAAH